MQITISMYFFILISLVDLRRESSSKAIYCVAHRIDSTKYPSQCLLEQGHIFHFIYVDLYLSTLRLSTVVCEPPNVMEPLGHVCNLNEGIVSSFISTNRGFTFFTKIFPYIHKNGLQDTGMLPITGNRDQCTMGSSLNTIVAALYSPFLYTNINKLLLQEYHGMTTFLYSLVFLQQEVQMDLQTL